MAAPQQRPAAPLLALPSQHVLQVSSHYGRETTLCMGREKHKE